mgnify:CR=1 FL=1
MQSCIVMEDSRKNRNTIFEKELEIIRLKAKPINRMEANKIKSIAEFSKKYQLLKRSMRDSQIMISNIANILLDYEKNYDLCRLERYKREEF